MYDKLSDEKLVQKIITSDQELYRYLVDRYQAKLMRYANYLIHNEVKSADVVQDTFIKAFINLRSFNSQKKFSSWLYRIAHNESMNTVKKYRRELPILPDWDFPSSDNLEEDISKQEIITSIHKCLKNVPVIYAEPLSLYYLEDLSYQDISDVLRLPVSTIGTRIRRAKLIMKRLCQKNI